MKFSIFQSIYFKIFLSSNFLLGITFNYYTQAQGFNNVYYFDNRSTNFQTIHQWHSDLLIVGRIGGDSIGLTGFFVLNVDTLGSIDLLNFYGDPTFTDHAFVDGSDPVSLIKLNYTTYEWDN